MRSIDKFASFAEHMGADKRVQRLAVNLIKHGKNAPKAINPTALWVDAALAVGDAIQSYLRLVQERNRTKIIRDQYKTLKHIASNEIKELKLAMETDQKQRQKLRQELNQLIERQANDDAKSREIMNHLLSCFNTIRMQLREERDEGIGLKEAHELQQKIDEYSVKLLHHIQTLY